VTDRVPPVATSGHSSHRSALPPSTPTYTGRRAARSACTRRPAGGVDMARCPRRYTRAFRSVRP
jgi:hypothetical protein